MSFDLNTIILTSIKNQSKYGLEIIEEINKKTNGAVLLKQPSLYSALRRLESKGYVSSHWEESEFGGKRHYYKATELGINYLNNGLKMQDAAENFVSNSNNMAINDESDLHNNDIQIFREDLDVDEDDPKTPENTVNYKSILGDFLNGSNDDENNTHQTMNIKPTPVTNKKSSHYIQEFEDIFKSNSKDNKNSPNEIKQNNFETHNLEMLENMAKKYNEKFSTAGQPSSEEIELRLVQKINEKKKIEDMKISRGVPKYLFINKMNIVSGLCLFFVNIIMILTIFLLYKLKWQMNLERFIILGSALFISLVIILSYTIAYKKFPDKKINYNFNWLKSFLIRFFVFVMLVVFIIAVNLLVGMESLTELFAVKYLIRWFVPSMLCLNILLQWLINFILSKQTNFQIEKKKK